MTYTPLNIHSTYSLLESPLAIDVLVAAAKTRGYQALALTDTNVMYGSIAFYKAARLAGLKPLMGLTLKVKDAQVVVIAETNAGYSQLLRLSSTIMLAEEPLTLSALPDFGGLAVIVAATDLLQPAEDQLPPPALISQLKAHEPASLYLGVAPDVSLELRQFATREQLPLIALQPVWYEDPSDAFLQSVLQAIKQGERLGAVQVAPGPNWLQPEAQVTAMYQKVGLEEAVANTQALAERAEVTIDFKAPQLPKYPTPSGQPALAYLTQLAERGLAQRFPGGVATAYADRLAYELDVIGQMGFADYFLIVWDVMNHAHEVGIMTGPGRGSAAGSLVSFALAITEVDPIAYQLLFERFLNPNRANMPDIDLDIPDDRRQELLQYVHDRYGVNHMAQIITFGTFGAKQAVRDVARVMGVSQQQSDQLAKAIPNQLKITLKEAVAQSLPLQGLMRESEQLTRVVEVAQAIEGLPRHDSTHAAGIVLSETPLTDTVALQKGGDDLEQTQVPMADVEALGLLKMDFLGLRNLTLLASVCRLIERTTGKAFDPKTIPLDDPATLALFVRGDTNGVFQFESAGIRRVLQQLQPTSFEDVVAVNALYRPGPMENIEHFIARKHGQEPISYPAPALKPILEPTYGVLVYQEQVMQVANTMANFTLGEADLLRRAMSKKKAAVLENQRVHFIEGAVANGFDQSTAATVFDYIDRFANYGFNRSHAVAYSMVAFWLAYLKTHYPAAFYTELMNANLNNDAKLRLYLQELQAKKVPVLGPDINLSYWTFTLQKQAIRFGLLSIKGIRRDFASALLEARKQKGPFNSLQDCLTRLDAKWLTTANFTPLIEAGVFDRFDGNRAALVANLEEQLATIKLAGASLSLFEQLQPKPVAVDPWPPMEQLQREAAVLGVFLSGHPASSLAKQLRPFVPVTAVGALSLAQHQATVAVMVSRVKRIRTKKGDQMAFLEGQDATGQLSITIFPNLYPRVAQVEAGSLLVVSGKLEERSGIALVANQVQSTSQALAQLPPATLFLQLSDADFQKVAGLLKQSAGPIPVITVDPTTKRSRLLSRKWWVQATANLLTALEEALQPQNVVLKKREQAEKGEKAGDILSEKC